MALHFRDHPPHHLWSGDDRDEPVRQRRPLDICEDATLLRLQTGWGMTVDSPGRPRVGTDALRLRNDLTVGDALATAQRCVQDAAAILRLSAERERETAGCDCGALIAATHDLLRQALGSMGVVERGLSDDVWERADRAKALVRDNARALSTPVLSTD